MRVAIFGASGLLGKALMGEWSGDAVVGYSSRDVDIRDASAVRTIAEDTEPEWIVLAAAYTDVDGCENNPELAFTVNRDGAVNVAEAAKRTGAKLLFLSSDYVLDGKKAIYGKRQFWIVLAAIDISVCRRQDNPLRFRILRDGPHRRCIANIDIPRTK